MTYIENKDQRNTATLVDNSEPHLDKEKLLQDELDEILKEAAKDLQSATKTEASHEKSLHQLVVRAVQLIHRAKADPDFEHVVRYNMKEREIKERAGANFVIVYLHLLYAERVGKRWKLNKKWVVHSRAIRHLVNTTKKGDSILDVIANAIVTNKRQATIAKGLKALHLKDLAANPNPKVGSVDKDVLHNLRNATPSDVVYSKGFALALVRKNENGDIVPISNFGTEAQLWKALSRTNKALIPANG